MSALPMTLNTTAETETAKIARGLRERDIAIGVALLALLPAKQASPAGAPISEPRFAER
jgi:hypothetical protein